MIHLLLLAMTLSFAHAQGERLVLIGGGQRPPEALQQFVSWAGGSKARVLVVTWATSEPDETFRSIESELKQAGAGKVVKSPEAPLTARESAEFVSQLATASAVYFTGGDQNVAMQTIQAGKFESLLLAAYHRGIPFAGTSAGTALASSLMLTGEGDLSVIDPEQVGIAQGLGLLPGTILDQHFVKRQRQNRLFSAILKHTDHLGIGVDEGTALLVSGGRDATVIGHTWVTLVRSRKSGGFEVNLHGPGETLELQ